jgi:hypothetical protein
VYRAACPGLLVNPKYAAIKTHADKSGKEPDFGGNWTALIGVDTHRGLVGYGGSAAPAR